MCINPSLMATTVKNVYNAWHFRVDKSYFHIFCRRSDQFQIFQNLILDLVSCVQPASTTWWTRMGRHGENWWKCKEEVAVVEDAEVDSHPFLCSAAPVRLGDGPRQKGSLISAAAKDRQNRISRAPLFLSRTPLQRTIAQLLFCPP